jgi:DNA-binding MarR family transcriptional regulator
VPGKLAAEIQQTKPFALLEEEAALNIIRTAEVLGQASATFFRDFDLSPTQYNVLRILRGAEPAGATCTQIGERMVNHDPDITRLLDRLESRGLVVRERSKEDRRVVLTRITRQGLDLVAGIDRPVRAFLKARLGKLDQHSLTVLIGHLEQIREIFQIEKEKL